MKQDKSIQLANHLNHLQEMLELAKNPKLLLEEMQILGNKAFALQEEMEKELDELETELKEVAAIQTLFETREKMWDMMNELALLELKLKEKTLKRKSTKETSSKEHLHCCCHEHHKTCCHDKKTCTCNKRKTACNKK